MFMMIRKMVCISIFIMLFSLSAQAQEKFSLDECVSLALKNSPLLKAEEFNVEERGALYKKERAGVFPQVELNSYLERKTLGYYNDNTSVDISIDLQKILLGYGIPEKLRFEGAKWQREKLKASLVYLVKSAYFNLLLAQKEYKTAEKALRTVKHHRDVAKAMVKSGVKLKSVLLRIDAHVERIRAELLLKRSHIREANLKLLKLIGLPLSASIEIEEYKESLPPPPDSSKIIQIVTHSPELKILEYEYNAVKSELRLSRGFFLPKLTLGTGYIRDGSPGGDGTYQDFHLSASIPIFGFGKNTYEIKRIKAIEMKTKWKMEGKKREVTSKAMNLFEKTKIMRERYYTYKMALEDIRKTLEFSEKEYAAGIISESDLLDIERNTVEIELEKDKAFYDYIMLLANIEYLRGATK